MMAHYSHASVDGPAVSIASSASIGSSVPLAAVAPPPLGGMPRVPVPIPVLMPMTGYEGMEMMQMVPVTALAPALDPPSAGVSVAPVSAMWGPAAAAAPAPAPPPMMPVPAPAVLRAIAPIPAPRRRQWGDAAPVILESIQTSRPAVEAPPPIPLTVEPAAAAPRAKRVYIVWSEAVCAQLHAAVAAHTRDGVVDWESVSSAMGDDRMTASKCEQRIRREGIVAAAASKEKSKGAKKTKVAPETTTGMVEVKDNVRMSTPTTEISSGPSESTILAGSDQTEVMSAEEESQAEVIDMTSEAAAPLPQPSSVIAPSADASVPPQPPSASISSPPTPTSPSRKRLRSSQRRMSVVATSTDAIRITRQAKSQSASLLGDEEATPTADATMTAETTVEPTTEPASQHTTTIDAEVTGEEKVEEEEEPLPRKKRKKLRKYTSDEDDEVAPVAATVEEADTTPTAPTQTSTPSSLPPSPKSVPVVAVIPTPAPPLVRPEYPTAAPEYPFPSLPTNPRSPNFFAIKKQIPCRWFMRPRGCSYGNKCEFSHDPKVLDQLREYDEAVAAFNRGTAHARDGGTTHRQKMDTDEKVNATPQTRHSDTTSTQTNSLARTSRLPLPVATPTPAPPPPPPARLSFIPSLLPISDPKLVPPPPTGAIIFAQSRALTLFPSGGARQEGDADAKASATARWRRNAVCMRGAIAGHPLPLGALQPAQALSDAQHVHDFLTSRQLLPAGSEVHWMQRVGAADKLFARGIIIHFKPAAELDVLAWIDETNRRMGPKEPTFVSALTSDQTALLLSEEAAFVQEQLRSNEMAERRMQAEREQAMRQRRPMQPAPNTTNSSPIKPSSQLNPSDEVRVASSQEQQAPMLPAVRIIPTDPRRPKLTSAATTNTTSTPSVASNATESHPTPMTGTITPVAPPTPTQLAPPRPGPQVHPSRHQQMQQTQPIAQTPSVWKTSHVQQPQQAQAPAPPRMPHPQPAVQVQPPRQPHRSLSPPPQFEPPPSAPQPPAPAPMMPPPSQPQFTSVSPPTGAVTIDYGQIGPLYSAPPTHDLGAEPLRSILARRKALIDGFPIAADVASLQWDSQRIIDAERVVHAWRESGFDANQLLFVLRHPAPSHRLELQFHTDEARDRVVARRDALEARFVGVRVWEAERAPPQPMRITQQTSAPMDGVVPPLPPTNAPMSMPPAQAPFAASQSPSIAARPAPHAPALVFTQTAPASSMPPPPPPPPPPSSGPAPTPAPVPIPSFSPLRGIPPTPNAQSLYAHYGLPPPEGAVLFDSNNSPYHVFRLPPVDALVNPDAGGVAARSEEVRRRQFLLLKHAPHARSPLARMAPERIDDARTVYAHLVACAILVAGEPVRWMHRLDDGRVVVQVAEERSIQVIGARDPTRLRQYGHALQRADGAWLIPPANASVGNGNAVMTTTPATRSPAQPIGTQIAPPYANHNGAAAAHAPRFHPEPRMRAASTSMPPPPPSSSITANGYRQHFASTGPLPAAAQPPPPHRSAHEGGHMASAYHSSQMPPLARSHQQVNHYAAR